jgi:FixJ family two-component response regulator
MIFLEKEQNFNRVDIGLYKFFRAKSYLWFRCEKLSFCNGRIIMISKPIVYIVDGEKQWWDEFQVHLKAAGLDCQIFSMSENFMVNYDSTRPACLIMELRIPEVGGLVSFEIFLKRRINIPVIFVTGYGTIAQAVRAMKMGAFDFMEKPFDGRILLERIEQAIVLNREQLEEQAKSQEYSARIKALSQRERQVLDAIVSGKNNKVIGLELNISHKTVEFHRTNIMRKMNTDSLIELVRRVLMLPEGRERNGTIS